MTQELAVRAGMSFDDMWRLAEAIAKSRLFGMQSPEQALVLMFIAQAEGQHPVIAARDYDIIQGRPAKKAEAMMRDFIAGGGKVEWHQITDAAVEATFSHPSGGTAKIRWDHERAARAGLAGKDNYRKFPRQMLRSRVVSEGVRTVYPLATSGLYVPDEVSEFEPRREPVDVTPRNREPSSEADMVAIEERADAAEAAAQRQRRTKAEVEKFREIAEEEAAKGTASFTDWWRALSKANRALLTDTMAKYKEIAEKADASHPRPATSDDKGADRAAPANGNSADPAGDAEVIKAIDPSVSLDDDVPLADESEVMPDHAAEHNDSAPVNPAADSRDAFWTSGEPLQIPTYLANGRPDATMIRLAFLYRLPEAKSEEEIRRLQRDSKPALDALKLHYRDSYDQVVEAIGKRVREVPNG